MCDKCFAYTHIYKQTDNNSTPWFFLLVHCDVSWNIIFVFCWRWRYWKRTVSTRKQPTHTHTPTHNLYLLLWILAQFFAAAYRRHRCCTVQSLNENQNYNRNVFKWKNSNNILFHPHWCLFLRFFFKYHTVFVLLSHTLGQPVSNRCCWFKYAKERMWVRTRTA